MKTAIIIHGLSTRDEYYGKEGDSESNCHWLPWLQKQLIIKGVLAQTPEMPTPYDPNYIEWKKVLLQFEINEDTILVGHSCGGGFITRFLSEENVQVGKVVLVAPWVDPGEKKTRKMFDFNINKTIVSKTKGITIFESTNDMDSVKETIELIKNGTDNIKVVTFTNYGHFCLRNMKTHEFPELLEECLK